MKKILTILLALSIFGALFSVHNFTINGQEEVTVAIGDDMLYDFDFESTMANAGYSITIDIPVLEIPTIDIPYSLFQDGLGYDETGFDGHFTGTRECEMSFPTSVPVTITLTDGGVADSVIVHYTQLNTNFSIAGSVMQESGWIDLPVPSPLAYVNYNSDDFTMVELMTCIANFFDPMPDGEYLVMELGSMFGSYQLYIPEDIPNVTCAVNVYSYLDVQGEGTQAPPQQVVTVNGHTTGIDFLYLSLDGGIEGTLADGLGNPVGYGAFYLTGVDDPDFEDYFLGGDDGVFNRGLIDGTYDLMILAVGYETYETQITISGSYLQLNIVLETTTIDENSQVAPKLSVSNYPNPFSATNTIDVKSDVVTNTVIDIYDIKGRKVKQLFNGTLRAGVNSFKWEATETPSGVYFWKVTTDTETLTEKILLVK